MSRMVAILVVALALRILGLGFGLPNAHHAYPYNPDEWTPMLALQRMDPHRLDFNPHYFDNPTFFYYLVGAADFAAHLVGWVRVDGDERFYFDHPEHLWRMLLLGRGLAVLFGVATVWLVYRLARRLGLGRGTSQLAALVLALHPSHAIHSHFMTVNTAVTFWTVATFVLALRWLRRGGAAAAACAGATAGLAISTKYPAALLLGVLLAFGVQRATDRARSAAGWPTGARETAVALVTALVAFVAGSPYVALAFPEFSAQLAPFLGGMFGGAGHAGAWNAASGAEHATGSPAWVGWVHVFGSSPVVLAAALAGLVTLAVHARRNAAVLIGWLAVFAILSLRAAHLATDSRFLPMFPVIALLAASALAALYARAPAVGRSVAVAVLAIELAWTGALLARFVGPQPQELASEWARHNVGAGERVLLTGTAIYWGPDLPVREYLQSRNADNYARTTGWTFVAPDSFATPFATARALEPDLVFLTQWLPSAPLAQEWLSDPSYRVVATFPGKVHLFGRRVHVPLDLYDVDIWALRPRSAVEPK